jgi:hypothetical protein
MIVYQATLWFVLPATSFAARAPNLLSTCTCAAEHPVPVLGARFGRGIQKLGPTECPRSAKKLVLITHGYDSFWPMVGPERFVSVEAKRVVGKNTQKNTQKNISG